MDFGQNSRIRGTPLPPVRRSAFWFMKTRPAGQGWIVCLLGLAACWNTPDCVAQKPSPPPPAQQPQGVMGGISSAGTFAPVYDSENRPITAGGFVSKDKGTVVFEDATKASGLSAWRHVMGNAEKKTPPHAALFHNNRDGTFTDLAAKAGVTNDRWLDIYIVNGSTYDALSGQKTPPHAALFHNNGDGTFTDVSVKAGVSDPNAYYGFTAVFVDVNNDGWKDLMMINGHVYPQVDQHDWGTTFAERPLLFHNTHDGKFEYVAPVKGVGSCGVDLGTWSGVWRPSQQ
jgi:hypothetical protein